MAHAEKHNDGHQAILHFGVGKAFRKDVRKLLLRVGVLDAGVSSFLCVIMQPSQVDSVRSRDMRLATSSASDAHGASVLRTSPPCQKTSEERGPRMKYGRACNWNRDGNSPVSRSGTPYSGWRSVIVPSSWPGTESARRPSCKAPCRALFPRPSPDGRGHKFTPWRRTSCVWNKRKTGARQAPCPCPLSDGRAMEG